MTAFLEPAGSQRSADRLIPCSSLALSDVSMVCSPSRATLLSSRYAYNVGMDGNVLRAGDERCLNVSTVGHQMHRSGVRTAYIGKYDVGYSSWACTPNCNGFEYFLGFYGPAQDCMPAPSPHSPGVAMPDACRLRLVADYSHGVSPKSLDLHENREHAPQYRGEYSTTLFVRKAIDWIREKTQEVSSAGAGTFLYLATQAVHSPIDAPPGFWPGCSHITNETRRTYCTIAMALDEGIGNLTEAYKSLGLFDDTVFLFLSDNGGDNGYGGYNVPLRGQKGSLWEGGVRSQTFVHWSGFSAAQKGSVWGGMAHAADWGVTLVAALGHQATTLPREPAFDGFNLWPALVNGRASPRTEMLLSMRDADDCSHGNDPLCRFPGFLAYRKGPYKLIYGKPALSGALDFNGWGVPPNVGASRPAPDIIGRNYAPLSSIYKWGGVLLFNIELDPLEEHDIRAGHESIVNEMVKALNIHNASHIDQSSFHASDVDDYEPCGVSELGLTCATPWRGVKGSCQQHGEGRMEFAEWRGP